MVKVTFKYFLNVNKYNSDIILFKALLSEKGFRFKESDCRLVIYYPNTETAIQGVKEMSKTNTARNGFVTFHKMSKPRFSKLFVNDIKRVLEHAPSEIINDANIDALAKYLADVL